ncbi:MAG: cadherin-like domain-containing protein, partial [Pseudomonadales bacterium]|nr:cadherin-like domain-containing protein [Pseudomonadales bacterium]
GFIEFGNTLTITAVNDAPVLSSTPIVFNNGQEDTTYIITTIQLLAGFSDVDGDVLSVTNLQSSNGALVDNQDGTYIFTPNANFNGMVNLTYQVIDGQGGSVDASNSFVLDAVNDAPVAPSSPISLANGVEDTPYLINETDLLNGFSDIDGDVLSVTNLQATNGSLVGNKVDTYGLTTIAKFNGTVNLSY